MSSYDNLDAEQRKFLADTLTAQQLEVVRSRLNGHTWNTIAHSMNLDEATIRGHHKRAIRRLNNARKEPAA